MISFTRRDQCAHSRIIGPHGRPRVAASQQLPEQAFELSHALFQGITYAPTHPFVISTTQEAESTGCRGEEERSLYVDRCEAMDQVAQTIKSISF